MDAVMLSILSEPASAPAAGEKDRSAEPLSTNPRKESPNTRVSNTPISSVESAESEASSAKALNTAAGEAPDQALSAAPQDFEIVLGRRQVASVLFVATVVLAVMCAVSYLAGKSLNPRKTEATPAVTAIPEAAPAPQVQVPVIEATVESGIALAHASPLDAPIKTAPPRRVVPDAEAPIFADPRIGATYIQMAAVDKGVATIFVEGLRRRGFEAFVAPGPSDTMFRVLIGPLADSAAYARTKEALDQIGLATFGRKYEK